MDKVAEAAAIIGPRARVGVPLGPLTTYRVGGPAALLVELANGDDLEAVGAAVAATGIETLVIGNGSNLLVADAGFPGLVVVLGGEFEAISVGSDGRVTAGGAVSLPVLARRTAAAALTGFEWAVGVPGSLGGAVRMNAGGHGSDMSRCLVSCDVADLRTGETATWATADLDYSYRHSALASHHMVLVADLALAPGDRAEAEAEIREIVRWRREHQPGGQNAGSVFTNPAGDSAGRLIEAAGLKGHRRGSAFVSEKHANFFQAAEGGSAEDVRALIDEVRERVEQHAGIRLVPELRMVGFVDAGGTTS